MPALNTVSSGLSDDRLDLAWRLDWIHTTDATPHAMTGQVCAFTPTSLNDIPTNARLGPLQIAPQRTPIENAQYALDQIRDLLDTAKQDRGHGPGTAHADNIWSTNDLRAMVDNEHGYYTQTQVEHARTVLAMAESSPEARDFLGITESGGGWTFSDIGHLTLDIVGMVPVVGNAADGINAAWYAAEGDYLNAALSSLALIPAVGQAVTIAKPAIAAASAGIIFKNLDEALTWARNRYGDHTVRVDRTRLEADIAAGRLDGVEVLTPRQVQDALQTRIDQAQKRFDANPSDANSRRLDRAKEDLLNALSDSEYLVRGVVPADYVEVIN